MPGDARVAEPPAGFPRIERGPACSVTFDGREVPAYEGESLGAALHAAGHRVLARSIKYHRPRGLFCMVGRCGNCLVRVDGEPNVRACTTPVRAGARVETQTGFPSARRDFFGVIDRVFPREFDYHERFIRPRFLTPLYHAVIRRMAGWGRLPSDSRDEPAAPAIRRVHADVLVAGAGPAGLAAAVAAAERGATVHVFEASPRVGGELLHATEPGPAEADPGRAAGPGVATALRERALAAGVVLHCAAPVVGVYLERVRGDPQSASEGASATPFDGVVAAAGEDGLIEARGRSLVIANGANEVPLLVPGNDLPGVLGVRAAQVLLLRHGVRPGRRVVVAGDNGEGRALARQLGACGIEIAAITDEVAAIEGGHRVEGVVLRNVAGETLRVDCDAVCVASGLAPRVELLQQADCALSYDPGKGGIVPLLDKDGRTTSGGVYAAGDAAGVKGAWSALLEGARVGENAAAASRRGGGARP